MMQEGADHVPSGSLAVTMPLPALPDQMKPYPASRQHSLLSMPFCVTLTAFKTVKTAMPDDLE